MGDGGREMGDGGWGNGVFLQTHGLGRIEPRRETEREPGKASERVITEQKKKKLSRETRSSTHLRPRLQPIFSLKIYHYCNGCPAICRLPTALDLELGGTIKGRSASKGQDQASQVIDSHHMDDSRVDG